MEILYCLVSKSVHLAEEAANALTTPLSLELNFVMRESNIRLFVSVLKLSDRM